MGSYLVNWFISLSILFKEKSPKFLIPASLTWMFSVFSLLYDGKLNIFGSWTFKNIILGFGKHWSEYCTIFFQFIDQITSLFNDDPDLIKIKIKMWR